jgi:c-di-GMP-binding flagellar brake protein YcgR
MDQERRRNPRLACIGVAAVQVAPIEPPLRCKIVDLSVEGCLIVLEKPELLAPNIMVELVFNVNHMPFRVRGEVRRIRSSTTVGLQFHQLSQRACLQLEDLIDELEDRLKKRAIAKARQMRT